MYECVKDYTGVEARTVSGGGQSRWFGIAMGRRQGCPLSPTLSNLYVFGMVEELKGTRMGVKVEDNELLARQSGALGHVEFGAELY